MALIKCKECGKEISDQATSCPNCGAKTQTAIIQKHNIIILLVVILIIGIIVTSIYFINANNPLRKYSQATINILEKYKNDELTSKETESKINSIYNYVDKEYSQNNKLDYLTLRSTLSSITSQLYLNNLDFNQIDEYIEDLRKY